MRLFIYLAVFLVFASLCVLASPHGRITQGDLAQIGQFPYQAGLSVNHGNASAWCGGTLISDLWVVTAAHCADGADSAIVYLGAINIDEEEPGQHRIYVDKANITVHANWTASTVANDIALIKLPLRIEFNERVRAVSLPRKINGTYSSYDEELVFASGWGRDSDSSNSVSPLLRYVEMPIMKQSLCKIYWRGSLSDNMICMSTKNGKSTCNGDSGGPLVYKDGDANYLIGATSFGLNSLGCESGFPAVFTRITSYLEWIEDHAGVSLG